MLACPISNNQLHRAFSHLTASTQFSSLGLVLLAALARASAILGVTSAILSQRLVHRIAYGKIINDTLTLSNALKVELPEDYGEVLIRDSYFQHAMARSEETSNSSSQLGEVEPARERNGGKKIVVANEYLISEPSHRRSSTSANKSGSEQEKQNHLTQLSTERNIIDDLFDGLA